MANNGPNSTNYTAASGSTPSNSANGVNNGPSIKSAVRIDKPSFKKRVMGFLFSDKIDSIASYLGNYILGPSLKDLIFKMGVGALQMTLYNGTNGMANPMNSGNLIPGYGYQQVRRDPIPYNTFGQPGYQYGTPSPVQPPLIQSSYGNTNSVSFDSKDAANVVLDRMMNVLTRYGRVRLADFYDSAEITGYEANWTLQGNGWYDLNGAQPIMRTDGRWILSLPPVRQL